MRGKHDAGEEDRLRALLRRGDPAADAAEGLPAHIAARMRARVVAATSNRHRPGFASFAWATAAAAGILLLLAIVVRPEAPTTWSPSQVPERPRATEAPAPGVLVPPPAGAPPGTPTASPPVEQPMTGRGTDPRPALLSSSPRVAAAVAPPSLSAPADASTRKALTVQFTTPAGTRIIWTLDPEFKG